jgi:glycerophosphoryl diester phosphodiesterase
VTVSSHFKQRVIGHRGACAYAPENTLSSFMQACQRNINWVEFDVMLSADGIPFVFHDETLDRTTSGKGDVGIHSFAWLHTLDAGAWFNAFFAGECIPTLAQTLTFLKTAGMCANIEIKPLPGQDKETVLRTLEVVEKYFPLSSPSILFSSFSIESLRFLREASPDCHIGFLMHDWLPDWEKIAKELRCVAMNVNEEILTAERVQQIKQAGYLLTAYTVNDIERAKTLFSFGVDAVFSDNPDRISALGLDLVG